MAAKRSAAKYLEYKNEVRRIATKLDIDMRLVDSAFTVNEIAGREIIDMKVLLFVAGMLGKQAPA